MKFLTQDGLLYFWRKIRSYIDQKYDELFQSVSNGKTLVANAITGKGIETSSDATFATMANNIVSLSIGSNVFNFPLTISQTEPAPTREGHIWIKSDRNAITNVYIVNGVTEDIPNNSLIIKVYDTNNIKYNVSQEYKDGGFKTTLLFKCNTSGNKEWLAGYTDDNNNVYLASPRIFTKINDVIYSETSFRWDGTRWLPLSLNDSYVVFGCDGNPNTSDGSDGYNRYGNGRYAYSYPLVAYNRHDKTSMDEKELFTPYEYTQYKGYSIRGFNYSKLTGEFYMYNFSGKLYIYRRNGDTFSHYQTLEYGTTVNNIKIELGYDYGGESNTSNTNLYGQNSWKTPMSADGQYIFVPVQYWKNRGDTNSYVDFELGIIVFKNDGIEFKYYKYILVGKYLGYRTNSSSSHSGGVISGLYISDDCSVIGLTTRADIYNSGYYYSYKALALVGSIEEGYTILTLKEKNNAQVKCGAVFGCGAISSDGKFLALPDFSAYDLDSSSTTPRDIGIATYHIDKAALKAELASSRTLSFNYSASGDYNRYIGACFVGHVLYTICLADTTGQYDGSVCMMFGKTDYTNWVYEPGTAKYTDTGTISASYYYPLYDSGSRNVSWITAITLDPKYNLMWIAESGSPGNIKAYDINEFYKSLGTYEKEKALVPIFTRNEPSYFREGKHWEEGWNCVAAIMLLPCD